MKIGDYKYKGISYEVSFCSEKDWRTEKNKFHAGNGVLSSEYHNEFQEAANDIERQIDKFIENIPKDVDSLVAALSELLNWTGYESCEFDTEAAKILITNFLERYKK